MNSKLADPKFKFDDSLFKQSEKEGACCLLADVSSTLGTKMSMEAIVREYNPTPTPQKEAAMKKTISAFNNAIDDRKIFASRFALHRSMAAAEKAACDALRMGGVKKAKGKCSVTPNHAIGVCFCDTDECNKP